VIEYHPQLVQARQPQKSPTSSWLRRPPAPDRKSRASAVVTEPQDALHGVNASEHVRGPAGSPSGVCRDSSVAGARRRGRHLRRSNRRTRPCATKACGNSSPSRERLVSCRPPGSTGGASGSGKDPAERGDPASPASCIRLSPRSIGVSGLSRSPNRSVVSARRWGGGRPSSSRRHGHRSACRPRAPRRVRGGVRRPRTGWPCRRGSGRAAHGCRP
jgi:hypothetical protein